jgi:hypothetical protein
MPWGTFVSFFFCKFLPFVIGQLIWCVRLANEHHVGDNLWVRLPWGLVAGKLIVDNNHGITSSLYSSGPIWYSEVCVKSLCYAFLQGLDSLIFSRACSSHFLNRIAPIQDASFYLTELVVPRQSLFWDSNRGCSVPQVSVLMGQCVGR